MGFSIDCFSLTLVLEVITHAALAKRIIYGRNGTRFVEGKRLFSTQD